MRGWSSAQARLQWSACRRFCASMMYLKTSAQAPRLDAGPCSWRRATPGIATLVFERPRMRAQPQHRGPCKAGLCPGSVAILVPRAAAGRKRGAFLPGCGQHLGSQSLSSHGQRSGAVVFLAVAESKELALCYPGWQSATSFLCRRVNQSNSWLRSVGRCSGGVCRGRRFSHLRGGKPTHLHRRRTNTHGGVCAALRTC